MGILSKNHINPCLRRLLLALLSSTLLALMVFEQTGAYDKLRKEYDSEFMKNVSNMHFYVFIFLLIKDVTYCRSIGSGSISRVETHHEDHRA